MTQIMLNVSGMSCGSCVSHVTKALESLDGVSNIRVDLSSGVICLERTSNKSEDLISVLNEAGYPAKLFVDNGQVHHKKSGGCCCG